MNVRVDLQETIRDGMEVVFKAPCDYAEVTGLNVYYPVIGMVESKTFAFADAHANDLADLDVLFAKDAVVKVILDLEASKAFVQNADTNAYLESRFAETARQHYCTTREDLVIATEEGNTINSDEYADVKYILGLYDALMDAYPGLVTRGEIKIPGDGPADDYDEDGYDASGNFRNFVYEISTREYPTEGLYADKYEADPQIKKPKYLILSGIHGDERKTCLSTYRFIRDVLRGHNVPQSFREGVTLCVMPVGTPSAINAFNRPSENAVDINRNFDWKWESGTKTNELYGEYTYGASAASEKETQAITTWLASHTDAKLFIDFHNSGRINEQVAIMGLADTQKKIAMRGIDRIIPYWKDVIGYPQTMTLTSGEKNVIFSYTATAEIAGAHCYAQEVLGIDSLAIETAVFYPTEDLTHDDFVANRHLCPPETIAMGAEALGNILIGFYEQAYFGEVMTMADMDVMDGKLNTLLAAVNSGFRMESGVLQVDSDQKGTSGKYTLKIPCTSGARFFVIQADRTEIVDTANNRTTFEVITKGTSSEDGNGWFAGAFGQIGWQIGQKTERAQMSHMKNVSAQYPWSLSETGTSCTNTDGISVVTLGVKAGKYNWTAYYWNE